MKNKPRYVANGVGEKLIFPDTIELTILIPGAATGGAFAVYEDIVHPGVGPPRHIHELQDEVFSIVDGTFDFEVDGQLFSAQPGDLAFVPMGVVHAFKSTGTAPGRLRYTFTPAGESESMFREFYEETTNQGMSPERMKEIASNYGQINVGPPL